MCVIEGKALGTVSTVPGPLGRCLRLQPFRGPLPTAAAGMKWGPARTVNTEGGSRKEGAGNDGEHSG